MKRFYTKAILFTLGVILLCISPGLLWQNWSASMMLLSLWLGLELLMHGLVQWLRHDFQWLITYRDLKPKFPSDGLNKFLADGFDPKLGWSRKPNTQKAEKGKYGPTQYHINAFGARCNPGFEALPQTISCYGDSFSFGRQVFDNETYAWVLSEITQTNVINFGVGNYGLDQSLLRCFIEYPKHPTRIVIFGVVPSTIVRIGSYWKHYNEFNNIFGFKPRFKLANDDLIHVPSAVKTKDDFQTITNDLSKVNQHDDFYQSKFLKELLIFPYLFCLLRAPSRHLSLLWLVLTEKLQSLFTKKKQFSKSIAKIMAINFKLRKDLYLNNKHATDLFIALLKAIKTYGQDKGFEPIFVMLPQKDDVIAHQRGDAFTDELMQSAKSILHTIDVTKHIIDHPNLDDLYSDDSHYGGHFSKEGNAIVASTIFNYLEQHDLLDKKPKDQTLRDVYV